MGGIGPVLETLAVIGMIIFFNKVVAIMKKRQEDKKNGLGGPRNGPIK
ncbi:MAG: hypothetical protein LBN34_05615 [Clostridiales Family XIII bacterium]|jgi:hypothetical protein|nr:hypothetical protein [Clostridiales Family XIII bacterium]